MIYNGKHFCVLHINEGEKSCPVILQLDCRLIIPTCQLPKIEDATKISAEIVMLRNDGQGFGVRLFGHLIHQPALG